MDLTRLWTTTQAAEHCGIKPTTWRAYGARDPGMPKPVTRHPETGEALYEPAEVRTWAETRPGRGRRTDWIRAELRDLARRIVQDAPLPRTIRVDRHDLPDGVVVLVSWHREQHFPGPQEDTIEVERLDSVWAIAPTRLLNGDEVPDRVWTTGERRWVYGVDLRDDEAVLSALVRVVAAARRDLADDRAAEKAWRGRRKAARSELAAAARRVAESLQSGAEAQRFPEAADHRRYVVRSFRDCERPLLSAEEIADAAGMTLDEVRQA